MNKKLTLLCALLLTLVLFTACGKAENLLQEDSGIAQEQTKAGDDALEKDTAAEESAGSRNAFPEEYCHTVNGIVFEMKVEAPPWEKLCNLTKDTGVRQYPDIEKAVAAFAQGKTAAEERREQLTDENGNAYDCYVGEYEDGSYLSIDQTFSCGISDEFEKIRSAFRVEKVWDAYNADQYLSGQTFAFATKEEALEKVKSMVASAGYDLQEMEYSCYSLDAETMEKQELSYDKEGNEMTGKYQWSESDDSYYFFIKQLYQGIPIYFGHDPFLDDGEANMPVQAVYTENGLTRMDVTYLYDIKKGTEPVELLDFDTVVEAAADKYGSVLSDVEYLVRRATLYEMPIVKQSGAYEIKPVWQFEVTESGIDSENGEKFENTLYTFIDAETGKEIIL